MKELTANEFATATATGVALVDFSTEWCAPCKTMLPVVQRIAEDGKVVDRVVGAIADPKLRAKIDAVL